jgi:hypothetical protein
LSRPTQAAAIEHTNELELGSGEHRGFNRLGEPRSRLSSLRLPGFQLGSDCDLNHTVAPFGEDLIRLVDLIEGERVRQEQGKIEPSMPNQFHQPAHPFLAARTGRCDNFVIA